MSILFASELGHELSSGFSFVESEDFGVSGHINVATEAQGNEDTTVEVNDATGATGATGAGAVAAPSRGIGAAGPTVGGTTGAATGGGAMGVTPLCGINLVGGTALCGGGKGPAAEKSRSSISGQE